MHGYVLLPFLQREKTFMTSCLLAAKAFPNRVFYIFILGELHLLALLHKEISFPSHGASVSYCLAWIVGIILGSSAVCTQILFNQGLTNPLSGCPGQVKKFAGQVKYFLTCPEKCIRYIGKTKETQYFVAEVLYQTSRSNFDLSSPGLTLKAPNKKLQQMTF